MLNPDRFHNDTRLNMYVHPLTCNPYFQSVAREGVVIGHMGVFLTIVVKPELLSQIGGFGGCAHEWGGCHFQNGRWAAQPSIRL